MSTDKKLIDELYQEINELKKQQQTIKEENLNYVNQFSALSCDVQGVANLVHGLVHFQDMNKQMFTNSCGVLSRSLEDISASMEASANGDSHFVG
ncbi:MAG: hypothetical protein KAQ94_05965 [Arcobacteraceae bacterium]|nr:hypothetical protein [Arcobacteraceae bacterium]